ncbi:PP-loop superfamily ATP-binding protein [Apilactobacillus ozensis DSM 23829 = JCM 17196]|uniref:PP-loop superfamily ATP-binding protein n=2 Tax=Apilactobacillus ozensis TaxID=866801 RepID=A0A0R2AYL8_9LACO|nr:PP-loop superfamily ATP-binding protein [Apilactobacillus ozensis DSM 23829 = JCM 17196]
MKEDIIMQDLNLKKVNLIKELKTMGKVVVAFSGGIDSTLVLKMALNTLGKENVLAVVANSELFTDEEFNKAVALAKDLDVNVDTMNLNYLSDEHIANNTPESWYYSKKMFYNSLNDLAQRNGFEYVVDGMIMDDNSDFRPGLKARDEANAKSVLQLANFYKADVRQLAKELDLSNWNKVASCSVSSRFPYNTKLTLDSIKKVMLSEKYLRSLGFLTVRVRCHDNIARLEIPENQISDFLKNRQAINDNLNEYGFEFITLDLAGFKSGRMNEALTDDQKQRLMNA